MMFSGSAAMSGGKILSATTRPRSRSRALSTAAIPPAPTDSISSKWPSLRPARVLPMRASNGPPRGRLPVMTVGGSACDGVGAARGVRASGSWSVEVRGPGASGGRAAERSAGSGENGGGMQGPSPPAPPGPGVRDDTSFGSRRPAQGKDRARPCPGNSASTSPQVRQTSDHMKVDEVYFRLTPPVNLWDRGLPPGVTLTRYGRCGKDPSGRCRLHGGTEDSPSPTVPIPGDHPWPAAAGRNHLGNALTIEHLSHSSGIEIVVVRLPAAGELGPTSGSPRPDARFL